MITERTKPGMFDHMLMFFLLGLSGIPFFSGKDYYLIGFSFLLIIVFILEKGQQLDKEIFLILLAILILVCFQALIFSFFKAITILGLSLKIICGYLTVKLLGTNFTQIFIAQLKVFSVISLLFFLPIYFIPGVLDKLITITPSFLVYEYELWGSEISEKTLIVYNLLQEETMVRNTGPFWEPGAFGGYLILALMLNTITHKKISSKSNGLLFFTIITTQSTTAYIAFLVFISVYILLTYSSLWPKLLVICISIGGVIAFQTIPFLGEKIKQENSEIQEAIEISGGDTRLASATLDLEDIKKYPFSGRGIWDETRIDKTFEFTKRNNGFTNFIAQWGILFFIFYFYYYYKSYTLFCRLNGSVKYIPMLLLLTTWILSFSENYFSLPFFWGLVFLHIPLAEKYSKDETTKALKIFKYANK